MKLDVTSAEMKMIDQYTISEIGIPSMVLMERAAIGIYHEFEKHFSHLSFGIFCGTGNNGGDGIALARILFLKNHNVTIILAGNYDNASEQTKEQLEIARNLTIPIVSDISNIPFAEFDIIVDGLFGIGMNRPLESEICEIVEKINDFEGIVLSIDVPSGLSADTGKTVNTAVIADLTYTIGFFKKGFNNPDAEKYTGKIRLIDIGYPPVKLLKKHLEKRKVND